MSDFDHVFEPGTNGWTAVLLHGTGGDKDDLIPLGRQLVPGTNLLSPDGKVLENGVTRRFFKRRGVGDLDIEDLQLQTDDLAEFISQRIATYELDPSHVMAIGLSNGANVIADLLFRHAGLLKAAVMLRPMLPYAPETMPSLSHTNVFVASGGRDPYVPDGMSQDLVDLLESAGANVTFHFDEAAGHGLSRPDLEATAQWTHALLAAHPG